MKDFTKRALIRSKEEWEKAHRESPIYFPRVYEGSYPVLVLENQESFIFLEADDIRELIGLQNDGR